MPQTAETTAECGPPDRGVGTKGRSQSSNVPIARSGLGSQVVDHVR